MRESKGKRLRERNSGRERIGTVMGSKSCKTPSLNRNSFTSIVTKVTPEGFWLGLQVIAKVPDPILFDELPEHDKNLITSYVRSKVITLRELERLAQGEVPSALVLLERLRFHF